jgi:uncharacterized protein YceK
MKRLILISLMIGLLMGCASTFKLTVDSTGKITSISASDVAVKYNPVTGTITAIPNRWFSTKIFSDIIKVFDLVK